MSSPAAQVFYAGSYAAADQPGVYTFRFDPAGGALAQQATLAGIANPSFLVAHPNGQHLYIVSETIQGDATPPAVWAVAVADTPAGLELLNQQPSGGDAPCHLALDATGRWLVVCNYGTGSVSVLPVQADGTLGTPAALIQHQGHGPRPDRQEGPHAHSAIFSPDQRFVIVADLGLDALLVYQFDPQTGRLVLHAQVATRPGAGPRHLAWQPGRPCLYVANELDSTLAAYDYEPATGRLQAGQVLTTLPPDAPENYVADLHVAPTGDRVYVSNRGHDSIAAFEVADDGQLAAAAIAPCGGRWPRNFAPAAGGGFLLAANQYSDEIAVLPLAAGAVLGAPVARAAVPGAACIQFAPGAA